MRVFSIFGVLISFAWSVPAIAWNNYGHMEVAAAAWEQLTPQARSNAAKLLKLNPMYDEWTNSVADKDKPRIGFITAATWPDRIKSDNTSSTWPAAYDRGAF